ncbi:DinB family protein [Bacillus massiliigorillae]|uniref:DinB family protein n=1 Tax=Bacillus massiliigorillae TaxID=1243664 RepID=UPI0003A35B9E|nr:DinB family protein [Bacillus massiliigorillae]
MYQTVEGFLNVWQMESSLTQKLMNQLTDESLKQEIAPGYWSLGETAWHIVVVGGLIAKQTGLDFNSPSPESPIPALAKEIAEGYQQMSQGILAAVKKQWKDGDLLAESAIFGQPQANGATLSMLVSHEIHHRGQMSVLMHQAGVKVPGIYGPSKDDKDERK